MAADGWIVLHDACVRSTECEEIVSTIFYVSRQPPPTFGLYLRLVLVMFWLLSRLTWAGRARGGDQYQK